MHEPFPESELLLSYIPILLIAMAAAAFAVVNVTGSFLIGKRRPSEIKNMPYECGMDPVGDPHERFSVKFFLVAMSFVVFDIEAVFFYPWAITYVPAIRAGFGFYAFMAILVFAAILVLGLVYEILKGVLDWGAPREDANHGT